MEVASASKRIVLDAGLPLGPPPRGSELLPDVPGLWHAGDGSLLGVVASHAHRDHVGLLDLIDRDLPVYLGARASAMRHETRFFAPSAIDVGPTLELHDGVPLTLGPFTVTPVRVDHGIDDAFALLVEADGRRLLYSGDLRGHGRDTNCFERLAARAGRVDVFLLEGTRIGRPSPEADELSESDVEERCLELLASAQGMVLAFASAHSVDRVETLLTAARRAGRVPVLDLYGATLWSVSGRPWPLGARIRLSRSQRWRVIEAGAFERTSAIRTRRIYDEELVRRAGEVVLLARTSALDELETAGALIDADAVWSMWPGYLRFPSMESALRILRRNGVAVHTAHSSGHASPGDLRRVAQAVRPERVVPIHTACPEAMAGVVGAAEPHEDGEWWTV